MGALANYVAEGVERRSEETADIAERLANEYGEPPPYIGRSEDGTRPVYPSGYIEEVRRWVESIANTSATQIAEDDEIRKARTYINIIMGQHWPEARPSYRPFPVINKIAKHFWDNVSNLTDVRLNCEVHTSRKDDAFRKAAENHTALLQANYHEFHGNLALMFAVMQASLSAGYGKVAYSERRQAPVIIPCGSDQVRPIQGNVFDFQQSGGVIYEAWKPLSWFKTKWEKLGELVRPEMKAGVTYEQEKPWGIDQWTWDSISPGLRSYLYENQMHDQRGVGAWTGQEVPVALFSEIHFQDPSVNTSGETLLMGYGNWQYRVQPGERLFPFGRMICTGNQNHRIILYDNSNIHWHAGYPFAVLRTQPVPWMWSGMSDFRDLWPIQDPINKVLADAMSLLNQAVNKIMVTKEGSLSEATWNNYFPGMPGAKIKLINRMEAVTNQIAWIGPDTQATAAAIPILEQLLRAFGEQSGDLDMRLGAKKQVPSPDSIRQFTESLQGRYRIKGVSVENFLEDVCGLLLSDIIQWFDRDKAYSVLGEDMGWTYFDADPETVVPYSVGSGPFERGYAFVKAFKPLIATGSALPEQRRDQAQMASVLRARRDMSFETYYKTLRAAGYNLPDPKAEWQRILSELKQMPLPPPKGKQAQGGLPR